MEFVDINIETLPEGVEKVDDLMAFKNDTDLILFSGELSLGIDRMILKYLSEKPSDNEKVCLILCTPGGDADSAYLIARKLDRRYNNFCILVNGYCKSAGTLLALGANELIVTEDAEFGPLDVQLFGPDEFMKRSSGLTINQAVQWINTQAFEAFEAFFLELRQRSAGNITTKTAGEIASVITSELYGKITDKIDPIAIGEMQRAIDIAIQYGTRLGVPTALIQHLVKGYPSHSFVIDFEEAIALFPNCRLVSDAEYQLLLEIQRILFHEFNNDFTFMPDEQGFLARINIHISDEEGEQSNEDNKSESSEASSRHEVTNQNPSINESDSQIHNK